MLEILVVVVHALSARERGLVAEDGSGSITILSKLVPTLLAVVHGIFLSMLLNDVKRTQAFANLASPSGASAKLSLAWTADAWWESPIASLPKRHAKKTSWSWALLCATIAFMFSFLIVLPFSSTLLVSQDVLCTEEVTFSQLDISPALPLQDNRIATTYFRTMNGVPFGPIISDLVQASSAKTIVFDVGMNYGQMDFVEAAPSDWFDPEFNISFPAHRVGLLSPSGCAFNLTLLDGTDLSGSGRAVWSALRNINVADFTSGWGSPFGIGGCTQDEIIFEKTDHYVWIRRGVDLIHFFIFTVASLEGNEA
ncbi:hypothetical protein F5B21DRAFT_498435 [Xylaria acuta]|nr:hypothetical protein F5B21DRAFT_498435 [Xylaria acuta]